MENVTEEAFRVFARKKGWHVTKKGWPDFLCFLPDGTIAAVEVKKRCTQKSLVGLFRVLRREQSRTLRALADYGIPCFISDGLTLEPFNPEQHAPETRRRRTGLMPYAWRQGKKMNLGEIQRGEEDGSTHTREVPW